MAAHLSPQGGGCNALPLAAGRAVVSHMDAERELWACALLVERQHGDGAPLWIAERIGALALAGDAVGVERWKAIADKLEILRAGCARV